MLKPLFYLLFILAFTVNMPKVKNKTRPLIFKTIHLQNFGKKKWDVKWFNNLHTNKADVNSTKIDVPRSNFSPPH
jgi:dolichyl-phosphate-mannose--protein O-mannosyl transferase